MQTRARKLLLGFIVAIVFAFVLIFTCTLAKPAAPPPLPNPNGYDDFVKAAQASGLASDIYEATNRDQLRPVIAAYAQELELLRVGLGHECRVPVSAYLTNAGAAIQELPRFKWLAQLLNAEGRLAELEGRTNDAIASHLDTIRFGNQISRGGFMLHRLVGLACEAIGNAPLVKLSPQLTPEQCRRLVSELETIDARQVAWAETRQNERAYMRAAFWQHPNPIVFVFSWWQTRAAMKKAESRDKRIVASLRLLMVELALRGYQDQKEKPAARLDDLVPGFLKAVPPDPFNGLPLSYRTQGTNWLLYSVGVDGVGNGGKSTARRDAPGTDLFYDSK